MSKNQIIFYSCVGIATIINEIGIKYGYTFCTFPLALLFILWLGLKLLPFPLKLHLAQVCGSTPPQLPSLLEPTYESK